MEEHLRRLQTPAGRGQEPRLRPAHALGHRNMPQWVSRTFVHPSAVPPPPPGPPAGPARDNDYEEIGPPARRQAAEHAMNTASRQQQQQQQQQQNRTGSGNAKDRAHCDLCGGSASAVRCDRCSGQVFCLSCDDMYHRHPKRSAHVRKAVDSIQRPFRPPLPPKSDLQPPVPPPRRNKRFGLFGKKEQSPALPRKESASGVMGSLKRFMGVRPLPPPPTQKGGLTSVWEEPSVQPLPPNLGPPQATVQRSLSRGSVDSGRPPSDDTSAALPATVAAINDAERHQRPAAQDQRDADRDPVPVRPRSQSVSAHMSPAAQQHQQHQQAWMYPPEHQHSHQHDMLQGFVTTRRGQSYRAGWPGMVAAGGSVCDMSAPPAAQHIGHPLAHPGFHPHMMHAQSLAQLGCPTCHGHGPPLWYPAEPADDQLHRYPSNSSLTAVAAPARFVSQRDLRQPSPAPSARSGRAARPRRLARSQMELSRYPTDSDEPGSGVESDDESDAPADEVAAWACPHCTFQNSAGTRVCAMCCRSAPAAVAQQRAAHRRRRRRRFPRGPMPPGSPAPLRARDPSPGSVSHGRERSQRSVSRGPSLGRDAAPAELADGVQAMKLEAAGRERRPSDAAAAAAAVPRRVSVASESAAEGPAQTTASVGTSDAEGGALPSESTQRDGAASVARKRTQSTGTSPPPQTIATQTPDEAAMYSEGSLARAGSRTSLAGDYEPFRYGHREARSLKRTQSFQAFGQRERQERADPWLSFGTLGSRFQGRSGSKSSVHSAASDSRAFAAYGSGASSRGESPARYGGESPARYGGERSHSRHRSYAGETARKPADGSDYLVGLEEVMLNRKSDASASQGMELVLMLRDAEQHNFSPEDLQIALNHCSERPPVAWLLDNLDSMIETVCTLATNYGHERPENDVGTISNKEARDALRLHKGNVWSAVTECVEQRRKKYAQLASRGAFPREDVITALTANHGSVEAAYLDLNRTQLKPFLMRLWGPPQGVEVNEGAPPGRPEVTPPPAAEPEVKAAAKPDTAEVRAAAAQADGGTQTEKAAVPPDGEVKVTPPGPAEVKVTPRVGSATVLASAKADIADSGSRSDQCSTLSSDIDTDDDDACKSKDYITPPTSPLFRRANRGVQPAPEPALAAPPPRSPASPAQPVPAAGPRPAELPQPSVQPPVPSSVPDPSPSSGIYETVATPAAATQHKTPHTRDDRPYDKPTERKTGTSETETKNAQPIAQPGPSQPTDRLVAPPTSPLSGGPAGRSAPPTPPAEPVWAAPAGPPAAAAAASDRDSSEDYEPAVYGELLVARDAGGPRPVQREDSEGSPAPPDRWAVAGSEAAPARQTGGSAAQSTVAGSEGRSDSTSAMHGAANTVKTEQTLAPSPSSPRKNDITKEQPKASSPARSSQYSVVKRPRPIPPSQTEPPTSEASPSRGDAPSKTSEGRDVPSGGGPSVERPAPLASPASRAADAAPAPGADTDTQERRSSDSSSSSSASTDVTEREQLVRPESAGWVRSEIYSSPAQGAPRAAPESTASVRSTTESTDAPRATIESTAVSETYDTPSSTAQLTRPGTDDRVAENVGRGGTTDRESSAAAGPGAGSASADISASPREGDGADGTDTAYEAVSPSGGRVSAPAAGGSPPPADGRPGLSPSLSPTPSPLLAASRHNLSPSERLELAKRVICNHVQRQRPAAVPAAAASSSSPSEPPTEPTGAPKGPPVHYGPSGPYTPASAAEIPAIEDGADRAELARRPRTLDHVTGAAAPASDSSGEEAGSGGHVVFTSSDSLSEGYEPVVSARFQPGVGRGGGVRSSTRSPMPSAALAASSSAESLSRSDHQAAPRSDQAAPPSDRQMTPRSTAAGQEGLGVAGRAEPTAETERQEPPGAEAASEPRTDAEPADSRAAESDSAVGESTAVKQTTEEAARAETEQPAATTESPALRGADETAGQTSAAARASESSDSDTDSDSAAAGAAGPSDVDLAALREGLKSGRSSVLRRNSAERQKVQRRASRLVRSGRARSQADAELAAQLMALRFPAEDSLQAASECSSLYAAVSFLHQECELCAGRCSASELVGMTHCTHRCCRSCAQAYFTQRIKERPLADLRCPFCNEPDLTSEEIASDYFSHLDIMLKTLVSPEVHALFHKKLFERAMMKDPNFKWCPKCSSGFIAAPRQQKLHCPDCGTVSCALCAKTWSAQHEGVSCERFALWQQQNDPDYQSAGLERLLAESGISCPRCRFRYSLAKGGCMHFTCSQCKYEFCSGCSQPFSMGSKCGKTELCSRLGLHAHHPRHCLFYLRDKEPRQLQQLLKSNGVAYDTAPPSGGGVYGDAPRRCRMPEQKETASGLRDDLCGRTVFPDNAGLCRMHYIEYLCGLVWKHQLDPVAISDAADLRQEMRRHGKRVRIQRVRESDEKYTAALRKIVEAELPLNV